MIALGAISGPAPKAGVVVVAALVAVALVHPGPRARAVGMLGGLVLAPVLLLAEIWSSPQLHFVHRHPLEAALVAVAGLALVALLAWRIARQPSLMAPLVVFAVPFRVPIATGAATSNLLVPLYLVVGAGALAFLVSGLRRRPALAGQHEDGVARPGPAPGWIERLLALYVLLYAIQALYSPGFEKALQQMVFFYVPFALMFCLLRRLRWNGLLLRRCLTVVVGLALVFAVIGFVEYATRTLLLNPKLVAENNLHTYFAINSVFFDPDIFGRFLALVMITVAAVLLHARRQRDQALSVGILGVLWAGLVLTLSRSSLAALLVGLAVLGALRWRAKPILLTGAAVVAIGIAVVAASPTTFGFNQGLQGVSAGRAGLVRGGAQLFGQRLVWGYGSGSFQTEYRRRNPTISQTLSASHTTPITIGAEQGLIGEIPYLALVVVAAVVLLSGARTDPARAAVAGAFLALVFHTLLYADFLEDPATWTLLGLGVALADRATAAIRSLPARSDELALAA